MAKDFEKTVRIRKVEKIAPDERGRSVWRGKVEPVELELVSTTALEKILKSGSGSKQTEIRKLAAGRKDGVLARDTATGHFRIVSDAELRKAFPGRAPEKPGRDNEVTAVPLSQETQRAADELSLVSTQILRKVFKTGSAPEPPKPRAGKKDKFGGFDPYDNN